VIGPRGVVALALAMGVAQANCTDFDVILVIELRAARPMLRVRRAKLLSPAIAHSVPNPPELERGSAVERLHSVACCCRSALLGCSACLVSRRLFLQRR
jgi:hypothetical protein